MQDITLSSLRLVSSSDWGPLGPIGAYWGGCAIFPNINICSVGQHFFKTVPTHATSDKLLGLYIYIYMNIYIYTYILKLTMLLGRKTL